MELTEKDIDRIRDYWKNNLTQSERNAIEKQMAQDPDFRKEVELQKFLLRAVEEVADERLMDFVRHLRAEAAKEESIESDSTPITTDKRRPRTRLIWAVPLIVILYFCIKYATSHNSPETKNNQPVKPEREEPIEHVATARKPLPFSIPQPYCDFNLNLLTQEARRAKAVAAEPTDSKELVEMVIEQCQNALAERQYETAFRVIDTFLMKYPDFSAYPRLYYYGGVLCLFSDFSCPPDNAIKYLAPLSDIDLDGRAREYHVLALWKAGKMEAGNKLSKKLSQEVQKRWKQYGISPPQLK
jgi:hypothetical protein